MKAKKTRYLIPLLILVTTITFCFPSCSPLSPADQTIEETAQETAEEITIVDQKEIDDYRKELSEWVDYLAEYGNNVFPLEKELQDLEKKRIEAAKTDDSRKADSYMEVEADKCEEIIEALHELYVPEIAKDYHDYCTNSRIKHKQWLTYVVQTGRDLEAGILDFDSTKAQNLRDERDHFTAQADQEFKRIVRYLNQKAKELDLPIPYPDQD